MPQLDTAGAPTRDEAEREVRRALNMSWAGTGDGLSNLKLSLTLQLVESQTAEMWLRSYVNGSIRRKAAANEVNAMASEPFFVSHIHEAGWRAGFEGREMEALATLERFKRASFYLAGHLRGSRERRQLDPAPHSDEAARFSP